MRAFVCALGLFFPLATVACDMERDFDIPPQKTNSVKKLKQTPKTNRTQEELLEARRKAGFKTNEEKRAEQIAKYEEMERAFVKGRIERYRKLLTNIGGSLDKVQKTASKWAKKKNPDVAFTKFNKRYKEDVRELVKTYRELSDKESRGGAVQISLRKVIIGWENLNNDLGPKIAEAGGFGTTLEGLRTQINGINKKLDEIENDDSIEPENPPEKKNSKGSKR